MIEVYIDGASQGEHGPAGAGVLIKANGKALSYSFPLQNKTNHEAEFMALLFGLKLCLEKGYHVVSFRTDSQIVEQAVEKRYVKNERFAPLLAEALQLIDQFQLFFIKWIPAKQNRADNLAKQAIHQHLK